MARAEPTLLVVGEEAWVKILRPGLVYQAAYVECVMG